MSHESLRDSDSNDGSVVSSGREVAHRLFAAEYADATHSYSESDEERAPNYVVMPTGVRVNRLFVVGVLTEVSPAGESMLRARVVDPTGAFVIYAGQYQPDAMAFLDSATPPAFVAVTGKARTFSPDDADVVYTSIRPEEITEVDSDTRDRWTVSTAERTLERIATVTGALRTDHSSDDERLTTDLTETGVDPSLAAGIPIAFEQYGTTEAYLADLQRLSLDVLRLVAGDIDAVDDLSRSPGETENAVSVAPVVDSDVGDETATQRAPEPAAASEEDRAAVADDGPDSEDPATAASAEPTGETPDSEPTEDAEAEFDPEEFDPEAFELDTEVRNEVESEFGTEFSTAAEVDTGEETPEPDVEPNAEPSVDADTDRSVEAPPSEPTSAGDESEDAPALDSDEGLTTPETGSEGEVGEAGATDDEPEEIDVMSVLLETMRELDDGDGADRETLIDRVSEAAGVSETAVSEAIQDALMNGQCYEPDDDTLKPI